MSVILGANNWNTNANLIADCARLGYLDPHGLTLDPTFGRGVFWKKFRPDRLIHHDLLQDRVDFRDLPYTDRFFQDSVFDPPYVAKGGRDSSGILEFDARYGLINAARSPQELFFHNAIGLTEVVRVTRRNVLIKVSNYVSSGDFYPGVYEMERFAIDKLGCRPLDQFVMYKNPRMQPTRTRKCKACSGEGGGYIAAYGQKSWEWEDCDRCQATGRIKSEQQHARNNYSVLLVMEVPK